MSAVACAAKRLVFTVEGTAEERQAQVRRGGIPFDAVDSATLACAEPHLSGVYACGEALDMDADCGGFNLAWAWTSGLVAGSATIGPATTPPTGGRERARDNGYQAFARRRT